MKTVALEVLGCRVNQAEAEGIMVLFKEAGYESVSFKEKADIYIIHTCTVTSKADSKSRQMIRKARNLNSEAKIVVTGCYAQTAKDSLLLLDEVDLVIGMKDRDKIVSLVESLVKDAVTDVFKERVFSELPLVSMDKTRAFIKIEEGCESYCTYCIIPLARGPIRSLPPDKLIKGVKELIKKGYVEIVLTGIHTGVYGQDLRPQITLAALVKELVQIEGLERIRFGSLDPNEISEEFLEIFTHHKVMSHLHLSLQSGAPRILKEMRRRYDRDLYRMVVAELRQIKPDLSITTDVMVGFPGETREEHQESLAFIEEIGIDKLHVFKYSKRQGTKAALMPNQIANEEKEFRLREMLALSSKLHQNFLESMIGKEVRVLTEGNNLGYSENYLRVKIMGPPLEENKVYEAIVVKINEGILEAQIKEGGE